MAPVTFLIFYTSEHCCVTSAIGADDRRLQAPTGVYQAPVIGACRRLQAVMENSADDRRLQAQKKYRQWRRQAPVAPPVGACRRHRRRQAPAGASGVVLVHSRQKISHVKISYYLL